MQDIWPVRYEFCCIAETDNQYLWQPKYNHISTLSRTQCAGKDTLIVLADYTSVLLYTDTLRYSYTSHTHTEETTIMFSLLFVNLSTPIGSHRQTNEVFVSLWQGQITLYYKIHYKAADYYISGSIHHIFNSILSTC